MVCRRLRGQQSGASKYELDLSTLQLTEHSVEANLINTDAGVTLKFSLIALEDSTFRIYADEIRPLHPRYKVEGALNGEPQVSRLELVDRTNDAVTVKSDNNKVVISAKPLKVELYNGDNSLVAVVNSRGLFSLEHLRQKGPEKYV